MYDKKNNISPTFYVLLQGDTFAVYQFKKLQQLLYSHPSVSAGWFPDPREYQNAGSFKSLIKQLGTMYTFHATKMLFSCSIPRFETCGYGGPTVLVS